MFAATDLAVPLMRVVSPEASGSVLAARLKRSA